MNRLQTVIPEEASKIAQRIFRQLVLVPNLFCMIANSDAVIEAFAHHQTNLENYNLSEKYRKIISLAVSQFNSCDYCIALHTSNAVDFGILTHEECLEVRKMQSADIKINALLSFTKNVLESKGHVREKIIEQIRQQGFSDKDIVEIISIISIIIQANYTANVGQPVIDFLKPPDLKT